MSTSNNHSDIDEVADKLKSLSVDIKNDTSESQKLFQMLDTIASSIELPESIVHDIRLVVEETFSNIVRHAFPEHEQHNIRVSFSINERTIKITFIDDGIEFNPQTTQQAPMSMIDHSEGGMGIHIILSLTDAQEYKRINNQNVFTVIKHYNPEN